MSIFSSTIIIYLIESIIVFSAITAIIEFFRDKLPKIILIFILVSIFVEFIFGFMGSIWFIIYGVIILIILLIQGILHR